MTNRYEKYKDTGIEWIGKIPEHWEVKKLSNGFNKIGSGTTPSSGNLEYYQDGDINWLQTGDLIDGEIYLTSKKITQKALEDYSTLRFFETNSLVIAMYGATIGKTGILKIETTTNQACCVLSNPVSFISKYVFFWFNAYKHIVVSLGYGGGQPNISQEIIKNIRIPCPPINEQTTIANYLDEKTVQIDKLIANKQQLIEMLKEEQTAIINEAVSGEGKNWEKKKLKYVVNDKLRYGANESAEFENYKDPRYIRITDFGDNGKLRNDTFKSLPLTIAQEFLLQEGDILFARSGATVGKTFQFKNYEGIACFAGYLIMARPDEKQMLSDFLYYFTKSSEYENWKKSIFIQATIQNIGADKYSLLEVPVPKISEQFELVKHIKTESKKISETILKVETEIQLIQEYRTALISEVVTGKQKIN